MQNYSNHRRFHPLYHFVLATLLLFSFCGSVIHLVHSLKDPENIFFALVIMIMNIALILTAALVRIYSLKVQDRVIRSEENLRHFILCGKKLDDNLTLSQITALRFASDNEFVLIAKRASNEKLSNIEIKKAIVNWKEDNDRV